VLLSIRHTSMMHLRNQSILGDCYHELVKELDTFRIHILCFSKTLYFYTKYNYTCRIFKYAPIDYIASIYIYNYINSNSFCHDYI